MSHSEQQARPRARALRNLLSQAGIAAAPIRSDAIITSLCDDSRLAGPGSCFVAVDGASYDGHAFVHAAVEGGATCVVVQRPVSVPRDVEIVHVNDTRVALARMAAAFFGVGDDGRMRLAGITGTNGKSTVAWLIRSIMQAASCPTALLGTIEYDLIGRRVAAPLTTPGPIALGAYLSEAAGAGATHGVLEVSSHALDQHRTDGLRFATAVFTNLSGDHLDYHLSEDAYFACKLRLFSELSGDATAVVNLDDARSEGVQAASGARVLTFGVERPEADVRAVDLTANINGTRFRIESDDYSFAAAIHLPGRYNVSNALAAAAAAHALGADPTAIAAGIAAIKHVPGRVQRIAPVDHPFSVLVDYAHTDDALVNVLSTLRPLTPGRLICVFGCGGDRDRSKRPRMAAAVDRLADIACVTSDNPRTESPEAVIADIMTGFRHLPDEAIHVNAARRSAIAAAIDMARSGDTVLIAGKGHENYQLIGEDVLDFDDAEVAAACLGVGAGAEETAA